MAKKNVFVFLALAALLLGACSSAPKVTPEVRAVASSVPSPAPTQPAVRVKEGENIIVAVERDCHCQLSQFFDLGVLVIRQNRQVAYFVDKEALSFSGAGPFVLWPGDLVVYGRVAEIATLAESNTPTARGWVEMMPRIVPREAGVGFFTAEGTPVPPSIETEKMVSFFSWTENGQEKTWVLDPEVGSLWVEKKK